ncbi:MAG: serine acetyltransferase, partial [Myxococcota bacterium]
MKHLVTQLRKDWERHRASASHRSMPAIANYRFGRWVQNKPLPIRWLGGKLYGAGLIVAEAISGIYLARDTEVGDGLHFVHAGGINIHPGSIIGDRVGIMHGVTLGTGPDGRAPTIGNDVFLGANASVVGGVSIGDGARVAANSLVITDVPAGALAIGVPAKVVPQLKTKLKREEPKS